VVRIDRFRRGALGAAALALLTACGTVPPPSTPSPTHTTPTASAASTTSPPPAPPALSFERAPAPGPISDIATDGTYIAWSGGDDPVAGGHTPNLYRWKIGSSAIETVYKNPLENRGIGLIAMDGDRVAFSESGSQDERYVDWNFLYVASPGSKPLKLAAATRPIDAPGVYPQPTISGNRLVYELQTIDGSDARSQLISVDLTTMKQTILAESNFDELEYWFPSLDGDRLVYGTVEYANDAINGERHVYLLDLADPAAKPKRLDDDGEASQPAIHGDTVVWKTAPRDFNANNWGQVVRYTISTGKAELLDYLGESTGYYLLHPQVGPRFISAEPSDWHRLSVYDLETDTEITVEEHDPRADAGFMRPAMGGNVYAWVAATDFTGSHSEIHFVRLPPP
jgi:hypothetical protein